MQESRFGLQKIGQEAAINFQISCCRGLIDPAWGKLAGCGRELNTALALFRSEQLGDAALKRLHVCFNGALILEISQGVVLEEGSRWPEANQRRGSGIASASSRHLVGAWLEGERVEIEWLMHCDRAYGWQLFVGAR